MEKIKITPALHTKLVSEAQQICLISGKTTMPEFNKNLKKLVIDLGYSFKEYETIIKSFL